MVTEQEARDMQTAIQAFQDSDGAIARAQQQAEIATAQAWFDTTIKRTLTWSRTQSFSLQFRNSLVDRMALESLSETRIRMMIIRKEIRLITERITTIKASL